MTPDRFTKPRERMFESGDFTRPLATTALVVLVAAAAMIMVLVGQVDRDAAVREQAILLHGVESRFAELAASIRPQLAWDEAVERLDHRFDPLWARDNLGVYLTQNAGFETVTLLDRANRPIFSHVAEGTSLRPPPLSEAAVDAADAAIESINTEIADGTLKSPREGRVQYLVAQPGEVLAAGGRVINMVDLTDVYMTFFLPSEDAGRTAIGQDVRLVLDAAPQYVVPAKVSFVADVAQFTPKTVETEEERQKLMFRIRARIAPDLLRKYITYVKTGLPGMAYLQLDPDTAWPEDLEKNLVK